MDITLPEGTHKLKILVVDDIPENLRLLASILTEQGYQVRLAPDGRLALESAVRFLPDLILLDIKMPLMSGYEVCTRLKANPVTQEIPVIYLSALSGPEDKVKAFDTGGVDYITKPFQMQEVMVRIRNQLTIQSQKQQLQEEIKQRKDTEAILHLQYQREQALNRVIQAIRNSLDLDSIFETAVTEIGKLLVSDLVAIVKYLPEKKVWQVVAEYISNPDIQSQLGLEIPDRNNSIAARLKRLELVCIDQPQQLEDEVNPELAKLYQGQWLMIPLHFSGQLWGNISLIRNRQLSWQKSERELSLTVADQLAIAIHQSQLYQQLQQANQELEKLANLDGLTQVANRRCFDSILEAEWHRLYREQQPLTLILCDVDYFKQYNDHYGHLAGDDCLKQIAQALQQVVKRPADLVARYGGEEFAVILPNTDLKGGNKVAQRIQTVIHNLQIDHAQSVINRHITISLGIATCTPNPEITPTDLIAKVDHALYQAKLQGRDRIVLG